jgi:hypothetical protein
VNGLLNKTTLVKDFLHEHDISILCLTETKLDPNDVILNIPGYSLVRKDRKRGGGGVAILNRSNISYSIVDIQGVETTESKLEILTIQIQVRKFKSLIVSTVYRPKFDISLNDTLALENFFRELISRKHKFFACGGNNIHFNKKHDAGVKRFLSLLKRLDLEELVQKPTRNNAHLDLIITNDKSTELTADTVHGLSDHMGVFVMKRISTPKSLRKVITFRNYKQIDLCNFAQKVISSPYFVETENLTVDEEVSRFIEGHTVLFDTFSPTRKKTISEGVSKPFISDKTMSLKNFRTKMLQSHKQSPCESKKLQIKTMDKLIRLAILTDTKSDLENKIRTDGLWRVKNKFLPKKCPNYVQLDPNILNNHYSLISNEPVTVNCPCKPSQISINSTFKFRSINATEVMFCYKKLKNRLRSFEDQTGLAPLMLSYTIHSPNVADSLVSLINHSLKSGIFPDNLKMSCITPVPKIANPQVPSDFRPVSVQPFLALLIEKCANKQLVDYISKNNILYAGQFGFRSHHSCETAMIAIMEHVYKAIDKGHSCILASLDLAKAFDVIIREFLLEKLRWYGIDPDWFRSYLSYRCQVVKSKDGSLSQVEFTVRGVPQGGVNSTLIFSLYINDLPTVVRHCVCILFADDTQLIISGDPRNINSLIQKLEHDLLSILKWKDENGMKLNADKTQIIVLGSAANVAKIGQITVEVGGVLVNSRDTIKSLGLTIDSKLTWIDHINRLSRSYHLTARSLCPLKCVLSESNFIKVIDACLMSKLTFMSSIWGTANKNTLNILERGMRRTARSIYGLKWWEPVRDHITGDLKWMLPKSQYIYNLLCIVFTITSSENHVPFLSHRLVKNNEVHEHHTRRSSSLRVNFTPKCKLSERSLEFYACIKWNELPSSVNLSNIFTFRKTLKEHILNTS